MKKSVLLGLILISLITFIIILRPSLGSRRYEVVMPARDRAVQAVYATGTVEATVMLPIAPRNSSWLIELHADEGSEVKKDQLLAQLEDTDLKQSLIELEAKAKLAEANFKRAENIVSRNAISKGDFDNAKANLEAAQASVAVAKAQLSYLTLRAPEDGKIIKRDGEIGQLIPANQAVFWMSCCAPLRVSAEVDEEDIALVQPGQAVLIRADAFPEDIFHGKVLSITPKGDPVARSYRVRVGFIDKNPLLIGMTAEVNIIIKEIDNALTVPTSSIQQKKIWIVQGKRTFQKTVEIGASGLGTSEIISGVSEKDLVVLKPDSELEDNLAIRPKLITRNKK